MVPFFAALLMAAAAPAPTPALASPSQAWVEAEANRSRMKTPPAFLDGPRAELPETEKAQGHHGPVVIQAILDTDGRMKEARVRNASGASVVDEIALAAATASTFTPAKDADGVAIPVVISMPFDLVAYKRAEGMGILHYTCGQFVRDMEWWRSVHPDTAFEKHELYTMELGFLMLTLIRDAKGDQERLRKNIAAFEGKWIAAIEYCRTHPDTLQRDAIYR